MTNINFFTGIAVLQEHGYSLAHVNVETEDNKDDIILYQISNAIMQKWELGQRGIVFHIILLDASRVGGAFAPNVVIHTADPSAISQLITTITTDFFSDPRTHHVILFRLDSSTVGSILKRLPSTVPTSWIIDFTPQTVAHTPDILIKAQRTMPKRWFPSLARIIIGHTSTVTANERDQEDTTVCVQLDLRLTQTRRTEYPIRIIIPGGSHEQRPSILIEANRGSFKHAIAAF